MTDLPFAEDVFEVMSIIKMFNIGPAVLAGGAIRDWLNEQEIKDYDFFIDSPTSSTLAAAITSYLVDKQNYRMKLSSTSKYSRKSEIITFYKPGEKDIQIIYGEFDIAKFDISTCQVAWNIYLDSLYSTKAYKDSVENNYHKIFMKNLETNGQLILCFRSHLPRVLAKYPWPYLLDYEGNPSYE